MITNKGNGVLSWSRVFSSCGLHFSLLQLPQPTLSGLHQITEFVWSFDYKSCLLVLNQMASAGSAFVLLSQFVPGIKVLIQVAMQLGVYIERR